ncbi:ribonuclease P protein component [Wolbachia endosymbiont of Dipetalonema caudispina]|uniref:ribonuclease P protein component n=1 Tax=Wolbachia endosymbiont of Dipetalonema caudispina TaxID=1812112 RepID=UPI00158D8637|nr:ribonuclease P protein component [Wolbachia endosymbiont of Dipetalonema caudispina]MCV3769380.1 ribonuclease P protein component [Wolbachia pipientis]QKX01241.1 ribonuclease P protein component [Wolbachia endosymbiont of Dipetalonema caudispina]
MHNKVIEYKKKDFSFAFRNKLASNNSFYHGLYISLYAVKEKEPEKYIYSIRTGLIINKKVGKAIKRNKIKRRLRMLIRVNILTVSNIGYYYIIVAHRNIIQASYKSLQKDLNICFKKIKEKTQFKVFTTTLFTII